MSAFLFFQIVALIVILLALTLVASIAFGYLYMRYLPTLINHTLEAFDEDGELLDDHFRDTPDPQFFHPNR